MLLGLSMNFLMNFESDQILSITIGLRWECQRIFTDYVRWALKFSKIKLDWYYFNECSSIWIDYFKKKNSEENIRKIHCLVNEIKKKEEKKNSLKFMTLSSPTLEHKENIIQSVKINLIEFIDKSEVANAKIGNVWLLCVLKLIYRSIVSCVLINCTGTFTQTHLETHAHNEFNWPLANFPLTHQ